MADHGTEPALSPRPVDDARGRQVFAVIGIDRYRNWQMLKNAVTDANAARLLFRHLGFEEAHAPLFDESASGAAIHKLVTDELTNLKQNDSLVLFYAGHGGTRTQSSGGRLVQTGYLVPSDADNEPNQVATWIDLDSWLRNVSQLPARHILVILDACHSGIALSSILSRDVTTPQADSFERHTAHRSRRIITSARADEVALDGGPLHGHSLFTGWLIQALIGGISAGDCTFTTASELGLYLQRHVRDYAGSHQTPDFGSFNGDERGEMLIPLLRDQITAELLTSRATLATAIMKNAPRSSINDSPAPQSPERPGQVSSIQDQARKKVRKLHFEKSILALGVSVSVLVLILAVSQYRNAKRLEQHAEQIYAEMDTLSQQSSTKYIGPFPRDIEPIIRVVKKTDRELRILCDVPGYGHYTEPERFKDYLNTLLAAAQKTKAVVRMLYYSKEVLRTSVMDQFPEGRWPEIQNDLRFAAFFRELEHRRLPHDTYSQFKESLLTLHDEYEEYLCENHVLIEHYTGPSAIFFWLVDDKAAVFAINARDLKGREQSFSTADGNLMAAFSSFFDKAWDENREGRVSCKTPAQRTD